MAEKENLPVWIVGHIPMGDKYCNRKWSTRYFALIERYQHLIRFQAFGHNHKEKWGVTRSLSTNKPIGVEYVAGNAGTYDAFDPSMRLYEMNADYHVPVNF